MLGLTYAVQVPAFLTKLIVGGTCASKEYSSNPDSIHCHKHPHYNRIMEIMEQLNDAATPLDTRKQLGREWTAMSFYSEEKLEQALSIPNSGKTVGVRLDYFIQTECRTYDVREELPDVTLPSFIYAGKYDAQCPYKYGVEIADLLPNATLTTFEESNHNPFVEEEEKFNDFVKLTL